MGQFRLVKGYQMQLTSAEFSTQEISTIQLFFGQPASSELAELGEGHFLESSYISGFAGDRLTCHVFGYIVDIVDQESSLFERNFGGLLKALEALTA